MSAVLLQLPETRRGRRSPEQERAYQRELDRFAAGILEIQSRLEFTVSSRGWCYILEEHGLTKGEFDKAQRLLNDCRKSGRLPLDICREDDNRAVTRWGTPIASWGEPDAYAAQILRSADEKIAEAKEQIDSAYEDARQTVGYYDHYGWFDGLDYSLFCLVEKVDLVTLFERTCQSDYVPIANGKGWADLHLRAHMAEYFKHAEEHGRTPVLLYCGDHDPAGLLISDTIKKNLADLTGATGWSPDNLIVDRFGLNADFIEAQGLSWIENLESGSGEDLAGSGKSYVRDYIERFGKRKVEANALVVRPAAARQLIAAAIHRYIPKYHEHELSRRNANAPERQQALAAFDRLRDA